MTKKQKKMLLRIIIAAVMLAALYFLPVTGRLRLGLYLVTYLVIGYDILKKAGQGIANGRVFDENFLMAVATVGAFALAIYEKSGDYPRRSLSCCSIRWASCSRATPWARAGRTSAP